MRHLRRDVLVIGHGVIGAVACWRAAQAGLSVSCLDPDPGGGASQIAAGMLAPVTEAEFGETELLRLNLAAAARWAGFAAELEAATGIDVGYRRCGVLAVGYERSDRALLDRSAELQHRNDLTVCPVTAEQARQREPMLGSHGSGGYWVPSDAQVEPRRLMAALTAVGRRHRVRIERTAATGLLCDDHGAVTWVLDDAGDIHPAGLVVVAAGHASGALLGEVGVAIPIRPVKGQLLRLEHEGSTEPKIIRGIVQQRPVYLVFRDDDHGRAEVIIGASSEEWPDDRRVTAGAMFALLRDARALVPGIDECAVTDFAARARPGTPDNLPVLGRCAVPGLVIATGHHRNGILLAPVTGDAMDSIFAGEQPDDLWKVADPRRFDRRPEVTTIGKQ